MPLNFGGQKRSGAFDTVWPSAPAKRLTVLVASARRRERLPPGRLSVHVRGARPRAPSRGAPGSRALRTRRGRGRGACASAHGLDGNSEQQALPGFLRDSRGFRFVSKAVVRGCKANPGHSHDASKNLSGSSFQALLSIHLQ